MDNNMTRKVYRDRIDCFYYELEDMNFRDALRELLGLLNDVRNRLFHGGKTYKNPEKGNELILLGSFYILEKSICLVHDIWNILSSP